MLNITQVLFRLLGFWCLLVYTLGFMLILGILCDIVPKLHEVFMTVVCMQHMFAAVNSSSLSGCLLTTLKCRVFVSTDRPDFIDSHFFSSEI